MRGRWRVELPLFFLAMLAIALLARYAVSKTPMKPSHGPAKGDHPSTVRAVGVLQLAGISGARGAVHDTVVRPTAPPSVVERSLVVHAASDRFTQPSGDAGARMAVGVIGIASPKTW